jgi:hypothetical protein
MSNDVTKRVRLTGNARDIAKYARKSDALTTKIDTLARKRAGYDKIRQALIEADEDRAGQAHAVDADER